MIRRWVIWAALASTLFACWWVEQEQAQTGQPHSAIAARHPPPVRPTVALSQAMPALAPTPQGTPVPAITPLPPEQVAGVNLFAALDMPAAEGAGVEMPVAVNPYTYAGRLQEAGRWTIFLTDGQQQYVLHEGDRFAEGWQVALLDQQKVVLQHAAERFEIKLDNGVVF